MYYARNTFNLQYPPVLINILCLEFRTLLSCRAYIFITISCENLSSASNVHIIGLWCKRPRALSQRIRGVLIHPTVKISFPKVFAGKVYESYVVLAHEGVHQSGSTRLVKEHRTVVMSRHKEKNFSSNKLIKQTCWILLHFPPEANRACF